MNYKYIIDRKLKCTPSRFLELKEYLSNQNSKSDPMILKMSYNVYDSILDIEIKTSDINISNVIFSW